MRGYPVMVNHDAEMAAEIAPKGRRRHRKVLRRGPADHGRRGFRLYAGRAARRLYLVGNGDTAGVHHPQYDFNDEAIPFGCSFFAELIERRMPAA
jgi:metal-dependent amidase/aminoacylase/carboxypeptidase family protein